MWTFEVDPGVAIAVVFQTAIYLGILIAALIFRK
jgi:hypothetical protein